MTDQNTPAKAPGDDELARRFFEQVFDLWINPEIERRRAAGQPAPDPLIVVFITFPVGAPPKVEFNDECNAKVHLKVRPGTTVAEGQGIPYKDVVGIGRAEPVDENAGYVFMMHLIDNSWASAFDFRRGKQDARGLLLKAVQFHRSAEHGLAQVPALAAAAADQLFSAAELAAHAYLATGSGNTSRNHKGVHSDFNINAKLGNVPSEHTKAYNKLFRARPDARYDPHAVPLTVSELVELLDTVAEMIESAYAGARKPISEIDDWMREFSARRRAAGK